MRVTIAAVGRLRSEPEKQLTADYAEHAASLGRSCGITGFKLKEVAEGAGRNRETRRADEAKRLIACLPKNAFTIVLDENGERLHSRQFAAKLQAWQNQGISELAFLIGGADGHGRAVTSNCNYLLSLGAMTWPHRLARVMVAEQIYRAITILTNHPYHRA